MTDRQEAGSQANPRRLAAPPEPVAHFLKGIGAARRQVSLYGSDHPVTETIIADLLARIEDFIAVYDRPTVVLSERTTVVNHHQFASCADSRELCERLRARGAVAFSLTGIPPTTQLIEFLLFLNVEPREVQAAGGASDYLRARKVTTIVAVEALYGTGEDSDESCETAGAVPQDVDPIVAAALEWLTKQDDGTEDSPRIPISEILSDPDATAKLVWEAVTKLHASRRDASKAEIAGEVVQDLRTLASEDAAGWDSSLPQVRKAISKLPDEARPAFGSLECRGERGGKVVEVEAVENMLASVQPAQDGSDVESVLKSLEGLFGAQPAGRLSSWQCELRPESILLSTVRTLETLMAWEGSALEHGRMARALASLVPSALESGDRELAIRIAGNLAQEAERSCDMEWRRTNAAAALASIDVDVLRDLVAGAMDGLSYGDKEHASILIRTVPCLALRMAEQLLCCADPVLADSFRKGLSKCGREAAAELSRCLTEGPPAVQERALEALVEIGSYQALNAVADACNGGDPVLASKALAAFGKYPGPIASNACVRALSHKSPEVREAAIAALGALQDPDTLGYLTRIALRTSLLRRNVREQVEAVKALARFPHPESKRCLEALANPRGPLGRLRAEAVRSAAQKALLDITRAEAAAFAKAA